MDTRHEPGPQAAGGLDATLTDPTRLSIVALLSAVEEAEFSFVRDNTGLSDSALSKQISTLREHGYLSVDKRRVGDHHRRWLRLTDAGRGRLHGHVAALQAIAANTTA